MQRNYFYLAFLGVLLTVAKIVHCKIRQERAIPVLLFPPTVPTRTQWIAGIGIPVENLVSEAITTGYVLKAEYFLPETVDQLRIRKPMKFVRNFDEISGMPSNQSFSNLLQEKKKVLSSYRWTLYKGLEALAMRMGLSGRACVLKSICEAVEVPFHHWNGMFGELLHILLTPSSSVDDLSEHADNEYFHAESIGRSGTECQRVFTDCPRSLLDSFSEIYSFSKDMNLFSKFTK